MLAPITAGVEIEKEVSHEISLSVELGRRAPTLNAKISGIIVIAHVRHPLHLFDCLGDDISVLHRHQRKMDAVGLQ